MRCARLFSVLVLVVAGAAAGPAGAQDANSAKAFLTKAYTHYGKNGKGISFSGPLAQRYFHSSLIALVQDHDNALGSDLGEFDGDIVCSCMDWGGIFDLKIDVLIENPQRASATVPFALYDGKDRGMSGWRKLKFTLLPERGRWRIWDIADYSNPKNVYTVREVLRSDIQSHAKASTGQTAQP